MAYSRPGWLMGVIQLIFVIAVIGLALAFSRALKPEPYIDDGQGLSVADRAFSVSVVRPYPERYTPIIRLNGTVLSQTQTQVTPQVGGRVTYVNPQFKQGGTLNKGDVIFRIDPQDYQLAVEQAQANIAAAQSDLRIMQAEVKMARKEWTDLFPDDPIPDLAAREPQLASAQARLDGARAAKKTAELALRRTRVNAAFDAKVLATTLDIGQVIAPNQSVGQLFALDNIEISVPVSTDDLQILTPSIGREAELIFSGGEAAQKGQIVRQDSILDARTRLATLFVKPESAHDLTVGSFVDVSIAGPETNNALRLPKTALSGKDRVWVVSEGALYPRRVTHLGETGNHIFVSDFDRAEGVLTLPPIEAYAGQPAVIRETESGPGTP